MQLCSLGHSPICYVASVCPVCRTKYKIEDIQKENIELKEENESLNKELDRMIAIMDSEKREEDRR